MKIYIISTIILLILDLHPIMCDVISGTSRITKVTQSDYGNPLESFYTSGITKCFAECQKDTTCQSVVYNKATLLCQTNSVAVQPSTVVISSDPTVQQYYYAGKVEKKPSTIRQSCNKNRQCLDTNSECRDNICKCYYGYSHDSATCACVTSCSKYGSTFQVELSRAINMYNAATILATTAKHCAEQCLQATSFTCRSYEFDQSTNICYQHNVTSLMVPNEANRIDTSYNLYTRDCF